MKNIWDHSLRMFAKFPEKLTFLTPARVCIMGLKMLIFRNTLMRTKWMMPLCNSKV